MRIACPRCEETFRIEPARLPAARVRTACLACGEPLFLRLAGNGRTAPSPAAPESALAPVDEVPIWSEPRRPEAAPELAEPEPAEPERAETERPLAPFVADASLPEAPAAPLEPFVAPAADRFARPLEPLAPEPSEPAFEEPAVPLSLPEPTAPPEPAFLAPEPMRAPAAGRPLEPFVPGPPAPSAPRPLEPFLAPSDEERARQPGGFTFSQVGDVSARAQRLARALVSDILVYHPKKVEQGLREGNLRDAMKEEVEKSWDEYCERLGPDLGRANRAAFVNALNEILARGKNVF